MPNTMAGQSKNGSDDVDQWKADLTVELALEFALRMNDPGFVEACITEMSGREEEILKNCPKAASLMACHTILTDFKITRHPPKDIADLCCLIERLLGLEIEYGRFPQFKDVIDRVCVQLVLILFRQYPEQYDVIESTIKKSIHPVQNHEHEIVFESSRKPLQFIRDAPTPQKAFEELEQRCPYNSAVQFVHSWLKTAVMRIDQPSRLDKLYRSLGGESASEAEEPADGDQSESQLPNICLSLNAIRQAYPGTDKQFRLIWRQTHPKVLRYLKENRPST